MLTNGLMCMHISSFSEYSTLQHSHSRSGHQKAIEIGEITASKAPENVH